MRNDLADLGGASAGASFDLDAAWLRRAQSDLQGFVGRFAALAESAFPNNAKVLRVKEGIFRRVERVEGVSIAFGTETFAMRLSSPSQLETTIERCVNGVVISRRAVDAHAWMGGLMKAVREQTGQALALSEALGAL